VAGEAFDLDGRELAGAALGERGGADVAGKDVRVAVHAEGHLLLGIHGVVPGPGAELNHSAPDPIGDADSSQTRAARVEEANDVDVGEAGPRGVVGVHGRDLAAAMLGPGAVAAEIQLAVQARARLIGDEPERCSRRRDIRRRKPGGMAGAIRLAETSDGRGEYLDAAARGLEGCSGRILLEGAQVAAVVRRL